MSTTDTATNPNRAQACTKPSLQRIPARESVLGEGMRIRRALPAQVRKTIGAWVFLDHFGPLDISHGDGMRVGPHPHTGLQTFTWPISGEILHRDSLGYEQLIRPGQINLMTAGRGISHSEESPTERSPIIHGAQLWIALPDSHRDIEPAFEHYPVVPALDRDGFHITVLCGEFSGLSSPVKVYSPMIGLELLSGAAADFAIPLRREFEHGVLVLEGEVTFCEQTVGPGELLYLPTGADVAQLSSAGASRTLLIGGTPYTDDLLIWWNFIGRNKADIERYSDDWNAGRGFGEVKGYPGARLTAPPVPWARKTEGAT
ncbi:MAG: pirin family protein [Pseudomonadota bacterium]|nr:pirin family protein [Pseudomonadota bacterium]